MKRDLYADVSARILSELENGAVPWIKPWRSTPGMNHPHNAATGELKLKTPSPHNAMTNWRGVSIPSLFSTETTLALGRIVQGVVLQRCSEMTRSLRNVPPLPQNA